MKINNFEDDDGDYERSIPVQDEDGTWTTKGELEDRLVDEYGGMLDDDWDFEPGPDCEKEIWHAVETADREREYNWREHELRGILDK